MKTALASSRKCGFRLVAALFIGALSVPRLTDAALPADPSILDSISIGTPMEGRLKNALAIPRRGTGHEQMAMSSARKARFAVRELISLITDAGLRVFQKFGGTRLQVGDLSKRPGGPIDNHGSHQNGRDADLAFFMLDAEGQSIKPAEFVPFDKNGYSVEPAMKYRFDDRRNWALVSSLIRSKRAVVQWIFVSDALKARLLDTAAATGASPDTISRARQMLKQPKEASHWDHFHVRIYCPPGDLPSCGDAGPKWAWARQD